MTWKDAASGITLVMLAVIAWLPSTISEARPLLYHESLEAGFGTSSKAPGGLRRRRSYRPRRRRVSRGQRRGGDHVFRGSTDGIDRSG